MSFTVDVHLHILPDVDTGVTPMNALRYVPFAGRLLIGLPFAMSGLSKLAAIGSCFAAKRTFLSRLK